jgi:hypothetical protein
MRLKFEPKAKGSSMVESRDELHLTEVRASPCRSQLPHIDLALAPVNRPGVLACEDQGSMDLHVLCFVLTLSVVMRLLFIIIVLSIIVLSKCMMLAVNGISVLHSHAMLFRTYSKRHMLLRCLFQMVHQMPECFTPASSRASASSTLHTP